MRAGQTAREPAHLPAHPGRTPLSRTHSENPLLRITRPFVVLLVLATGALGDSGLAAAQPPGPQGFDNTDVHRQRGRLPTLHVGEGTAQQVVPPAGAPFYTLSLYGYPRAEAERHPSAPERGTSRSGPDPQVGRLAGCSTRRGRRRRRRHVHVRRRRGVREQPGAPHRVQPCMHVGDCCVLRRESGTPADLQRLQRRQHSTRTARPRPSATERSCKESEYDCTVTTATKPQTAVKNARAGAAILRQAGQ